MSRWISQVSASMDLDAYEEYDEPPVEREPDCGSFMVHATAPLSTGNYCWGELVDGESVMLPESEEAAREDALLGVGIPVVVTDPVTAPLAPETMDVVVWEGRR